MQQSFVQSIVLLLFFLFAILFTNFFLIEQLGEREDKFVEVTQNMILSRFAKPDFEIIGLNSFSDVAKNVAPTINLNKSSSSSASKSNNVPTVALSILTKGSIENDSNVLEIVEFGDLQCAFTKKFYNETFKEIKKKYVDTGMIKFAYKDFPIHDFSELYAEAARCAKEQGKFWEFIEAIFSISPKQTSEHDHSKKEFDSTPIFDSAKKIELNQQDFSECFESKKYEKDVYADKAEAQKLGVRGTPTFFIVGKESFMGAKTLPEFEAIIKKYLQ